MTIRRWQAGEGVSAITEMLHRAYAELAAMGLHYCATDQDDAATRQRMEKDVSWVAEADGVIVGTVALCPWTSLGEPEEAYRRPGLWIFHQYGVEPSLQRKGIGTALLEAAEDHAREHGALEFACDTAIEATHLVSMYKRKGFEVVGKVDFDNTNYESYIFVKKLA